MPELPEVECTVRSLKPVIGRAVASATLNRADIVVGRSDPEALLAGRRISSITRHGKEILVEGKRLDRHNPNKSWLIIHLGMTGSLQIVPSKNIGGPDTPVPSKHSHVLWLLDNGDTMVFNDPRRFGGIWTYNNQEEISRRWDRLGPDALVVRPKKLHAHLQKTSRCIKACLMDQKVIAGLGNIYTDELLFACKIRPTVRANQCSLFTAALLVRKMRKILRSAINHGGSTLQDYVDATGQMGRFQNIHKVYGRKNLPCVSCKTLLRPLLVAGRTTVFCPQCQEKIGN